LCERKCILFAGKKMKWKKNIGKSRGKILYPLHVYILMMGDFVFSRVFVKV